MKTYYVIYFSEPDDKSGTRTLTVMNKAFATEEAAEDALSSVVPSRCPIVVSTAGDSPLEHPPIPIFGGCESRG